MLLDSIKNGPDRGLNCIDYTDEMIQIYGDEMDADYQRIEFMLTPCNYLLTEYNYTGDTIHEECVRDLAAQKNYTGPLKFIIYSNDEKFQNGYFGEESIERLSKVT